MGIFLIGGSLPGGRAWAEEAAASAAGPAEAAPRFSGSLQVGVASAFQLSLGGWYGDAPTPQNRATFNVDRVLNRADTLSVSGFSSHHLGVGHVNTELAVNYRTPVGKALGGSFTWMGGFRRWNFPSVLTGTTDYVLESAVHYTRQGKVPFRLTANPMVLTHSTLGRGALLLFQGQTEQKLLRRRPLTVALRHGPVFIHSVDTYHRGGPRVLRYSASVVVSHGAYTWEACLRPQLGLQDSVKNYRFWSVSLTRYFGG